MRPPVQIFVFDRFVNKVLNGDKRQAMLFGKSKVRPPLPGSRFELVRPAGDRRLIFARGVCEWRQFVTITFADAFDRIAYSDGRSYAVSSELERFAVEEGFKSWHQLRTFHVNAGRAFVDAAVVGWHELEIVETPVAARPSNKQGAAQ